MHSEVVCAAAACFALPSLFAFPICIFASRFLLGDISASARQFTPSLASTCSEGHSESTHSAFHYSDHLDICAGLLISIYTSPYTTAGLVVSSQLPDPTGAMRCSFTCNAKSYHIKDTHDPYHPLIHSTGLLYHPFPLLPFGTYILSSYSPYHG